MKRIGILLTLFMLIIPLIPSSVSADGCIFVPREFDIYEPGQNAIIAWNGHEETMVLSVDVYSNSGNTKAVHVVPFPSLPEYTLSDAGMFYAIQNHMWERRGYRNNIPSFHTLFYEEYLNAADGGIDVISHERIGPHEITVVGVSTSYEFQNWANKYFKTHGLENVELPENTREVIDFYLIKGYSYFVFDIIDIEETEHAIDPLAYTFETSMPYFPLKISSLLTGYATIDLAFITPANFAFSYNSLKDIGFICESTNLWSKTSMEYFNKTIADKFEGDTILEHYRGENIDLGSIDNDIELELIDNVWLKAESDYIYKPIKGDFDQNGFEDIMYFNSDGINLLDLYTGNIIWFVDTSGYPNYNDINYIDINSDGIDDIIIYDNLYLYIIDPTNGNVLFNEGPCYLQDINIIDNKFLYILDHFSIMKVDLLSQTISWECNLDEMNQSISFWDYAEKMFNVDYYWDLYQYAYEDYDSAYRCYRHYYYPFDTDIFTFCNISNKNEQDLVTIFRNTTCLINDTSGTIVWQSFIDEELFNLDLLLTVSAMDDRDNDSISDVNLSTSKSHIILSGRNGSVIESGDHYAYGGTGSNSNDYRQPDYNVFKDDFDGDGIDDQVLYKKYTSWEDDYRNVSYSIYFSNNKVWIHNQSIYLDILPYYRIDEVSVINSTIIFKFYYKVFGVDILLNEVIWVVDLGVPIYCFNMINIDNDPKNEIVICTENKIFGIDIPSMEIPVMGNTSVTLGPFTYNDGIIPIKNGSVFFENEDGLVMVSETNKTGELSININPDKYQCSLKIGNEVYIDHFNVTISDQGIVAYGTKDGNIPSSAKSAPESNDEAKEPIINFYLSILIIIIFIVILIEFLIIKPKKNR